jgi:hypothetical protein
MWAFTSHKSMNELAPEFWPNWATGMAGNICIGAQLCTRDGRRTGNAVVTRLMDSNSGTWQVLTDAGNTIFLNEKEIKESFYPPRWTMDIDSCPGRQYKCGADDQLKEVEKYLQQNAMKHAFEIHEFHEAMRPSPKQTLEQVAMQMLDIIESTRQFIPEITDTIRRAIKGASNE